MRRTKRVARLHQNDADAACFARLGSAAAAAAGGKSSRVYPQLPRGNCPGAENSGGYRRENDVLDCLTHGSSSLFQQA